VCQKKKARPRRFVLKRNVEIFETERNRFGFFLLTNRFPSLTRFLPPFFFSRCVCDDDDDDDDDEP